ncbi:hypothetical protein DFP72DRAFT_908850 [Ephemerocybe angulata]|uniref:Secreted protein n=1 Tax=Ephemerocybe angulata TaxID=980116 RepID=A0A8H6H9T9_9AGAR|nr:hypothetical protein DFP72DRAFT_935441 [Tulosesus angulatus]KAF6750928.1 hypothetical protein DFP72DRAFT_908850 [Tulosesus angulatus]
MDALLVMVCWPWAAMASCSSVLPRPSALLVAWSFWDGVFRLRVRSLELLPPSLVHSLFYSFIRSLLQLCNCTFALARPVRDAGIPHSAPGWVLCTLPLCRIVCSPVRQALGFWMLFR